ncbi:MAG: hypothetical protein WCR08_04680 [Gammaproteobacteria bacterium]
MKSITDLLEDSKASTNDWYVYAKDIYESVTFPEGTEIALDDLADEFLPKISRSLTIQDLSFLQIQHLIHAVKDVVEEKAATEDAGWIVAWSGTTYLIIQEGLNKKLQQSVKQPIFKNSESLFETIKQLNSVFPIAKKAEEKQNEQYAALVTKIKEEVTQYKKDLNNANSMPHKFMNILTQEEAYLNSQTVPIEEKLSRQEQMLAKLSDFAEMLVNYTKYLSLHADDKTPAKLAVIQNLRYALNSKFLPPCMKIYTMEQIINDKKDLLMHDTWGESIVNFIQDIIGIFFTRTPTESEVYKEKLFSMKQDEVKAQETTPPSQQQRGKR